MGSVVPLAMFQWNIKICTWLDYFYWTRVWSLAMLVSNWLTDWLTHSCLVDLIDVTLASEDANSKLVEDVSVADVDFVDRVGNSLLQIQKLRSVHRAKLLFKLCAQGLVNILKLNFRQDFWAGVWSVFSSWCFVEVIKLNHGRDSEASLALVKILNFMSGRHADVSLRFWSCCLCLLVRTLVSRT